MAEVGMQWLLAHRPDIRPDHSVNEGGGERLELSDGRLLYSVGVGEKGTYPARVTALGEAGHGSTPTVGDNAVPHLGEVLARIGRGLPEPVPHPAVDAMLRVLVGDYDETGLADALARAGALHPELAHLLPAVAGITMAPTMVGASNKRNVMPSRAWVELDCRIQPGMTEADVEAAVRARLGDDLAYDLSWPEPLIAGGASPPDGPVVDAVAVLPGRGGCRGRAAAQHRHRLHGLGVPPRDRRHRGVRLHAVLHDAARRAHRRLPQRRRAHPRRRPARVSALPPAPGQGRARDEGARPRHPDRQPRAGPARRDHRRGRRSRRPRDGDRGRRRTHRRDRRRAPRRQRVERPGLRGVPPAQRQRRDDRAPLAGGGRAAPLPRRDHQHPQRRRRARRDGGDRGRRAAGRCRGLGVARRRRDVGRLPQRRRRLPRDSRARARGLRAPRRPARSRRAPSAVAPG